jgi:AcrR family transcriptional regulator
MVTHAQFEHRTSADELIGRRERKRNETVERLLQAAIELFAKHGFANTRVEEITEIADVAKGTFFNYFPSKEHILMHLAGRQVGKIERCLDKTRAGEYPIEDLLRSLAHDLTSLPGRTPALARSLMAAFLSNEEVRKVMRQEIAGRAREVLAEVIGIGQKRGEIRNDIASIEIARAFQQSMFGTVLLWSLKPIDPLATLIEQTMDILWGGMRVSDPRSPRKLRKR